MPTIIEVNVETGEVVEREMTPEEIAALPEPQPESTPVPEVNTLEKLKQFLASNPDVAELIKGT